MTLSSEPSVVPGILLSDNSIVEQGTGKRSIIGIFDQLKMAQFPAKIGRFWTTAWITNLEGTLSEMELTCRIEEQGSAHVVFSVSTKVEFGEEKVFDRQGVMAISLPVQGVELQKPGTYTIVLLIAGEEVGKRDFQVLQEANQ